MKKLLILLLVCVLLLSGCTAALPLAGSTATSVPGVSVRLPEAQAPAELDTRETATLYFRYLAEPFLAPETRIITASPSRAYEMTLLTALLAGPGSHATDLTALFPAGTRVLSTVTQGRTLFVTLSQEILSPYPDDAGISAAEQQLRRQLCMQSIVATVTENCDIDQVQILVEQTGAASGSLRLQESYFLQDPASTRPVGPMTRNPDLLLTPSRTMELVCSLWKSRDWQRLYQYIALRDPTTGAGRVSYRDFVTAMENLPLLSGYTISGGSVTLDGTQATYVFDAATLQGSRETFHQGCILRLCRESGLWRVSLPQLTGWLEE
ncbi:MAG: GerMN domain-containing protein [Clostridia bacterium]|nr:GerMN domain-containing protein [Clostridia bacterium]